jgi:3'(2'), 5'-bisphosphate nucleotidase
VATFETAPADLMEGLTAISVSAAAAIFRAKDPGGVGIKADGSPVTDSDMAAEAVIRDGLYSLAPRLPIISEEEARRDTDAVSSGRYFLVDPLDGTREFIAGHDDYTINIALMSAGAPVLGIVTAPALGLIWRGAVGGGADRLAFSADQISAPQPIHTRARPPSELIVLVSRSHLDTRTEAYLKGLAHARCIACGSSVKFCRVAEGMADHYPRLGPVRDWDVAAGHAVLVAAGGSVTTPDGTPLIYGTPELRIPGFLAWGAPASAPA